MEHQQDQLKKDLFSVIVAAVYIDQTPTLRKLRDDIIEDYAREHKLALGEIGASEIILHFALHITNARWN